MVKHLFVSISILGKSHTILGVAMWSEKLGKVRKKNTQYELRWPQLNRFFVVNNQKYNDVGKIVSIG